MTVTKKMMELALEGMSLSLFHGMLIAFNTNTY